MRVVGVDIGGTKVLAALVEVTATGAHEVLGTHRVALPPGPGSAGPEAGARAVAAAVAVAAEAVVAPGAAAQGARGADRPRALGLGVAGFVGLDGIPALSPHVAPITGVDLGALVGELAGMPVTVDNDANCVALAALAARRPAVRDLVAVTLGTGIGGGVVVDGRVRRGANGFAGEPGHMVVDPQGPPCPCGQRGCWERYASGPGLERLARGAGLDAADGPAVVRAARSGDLAAQRVMDEFADWVALGLANVVNLLDPELVVVGGGLADAADAFLPGVRARLAANPTLRFRPLAVEAAPGGGGAGALGAALLAAGPAAGPGSDRVGGH